MARVDRFGGPAAAVLGLEASCDETAAAVVRARDGAVLAEAVLDNAVLRDVAAKKW